MSVDMYDWFIILNLFSVDYDALSALDADVVPVPAMTDEQINDLPSFSFGVQSPPGCTHDIKK